MITIHLKVKKILSYQTLVYKNGYKTFKKKQYKEYFNEIAEQLPKDKFEDPISVDIVYFCATRVIGDLDNITKPILDILETCEVIKNDKLVEEMHLKKIFGTKENKIIIKVRRLYE